eukprot:1185572-Prorocentrum_minimum.AAC.4
MVDRRGLLSDILNALQPLPLEVKRAAITTSPDGIVTDIFDVKLDDGAGLDSDQLRTQVRVLAMPQTQVFPSPRVGRTDPRVRTGGWAL